MRIYRGLDSLTRPLTPTICALGVFDGVHRGHQSILMATSAQAKVDQQLSVALTFSPHPKQVLQPEKAPPLLTSLDQRLQLIESAGIEACVVVRFDLQFAQLSPEAFVERVLMNSLNAGVVFVGQSFAFGRNRQGSLDVLSQLGAQQGFQVNVVPPVEIAGQPVSSTMIRQWVRQGELSQATEALGRPFSIMGVVVRGDGRGTALGFPTANVEPHQEIIPPPGVYTAHVVTAGEAYDGIVNIGCRPTFGPEIDKSTVEAHLFDFSSDLYEQQIEVQLLTRIRDEIRFSSEEELVRQMHEDKRQAHALLNDLPASPASSSR